MNKKIHFKATWTDKDKGQCQQIGEVIKDVL